MQSGLYTYVVETMKCEKVVIIENTTTYFSFTCGLNSLQRLLDPQLLARARDCDGGADKCR